MKSDSDSLGSSLICIFMKYGITECMVALLSLEIVGAKHLRHAGAMHLVKSVAGCIGWASKRIYENKIFLIEKSHSSSKWCSSQFSISTSLGMFLLIWSYSGQCSDGGGFSWDMYRLLH